jgi:hypothetical protein
VLEVPGLSCATGFSLLSVATALGYWLGTLSLILPVSISMLTRTSTLTCFLLLSLAIDAGPEPADITLTWRGNWEFFINKQITNFTAFIGNKLVNM